MSISAHAVINCIKRLKAQHEEGDGRGAIIALFGVNCCGERGTVGSIIGLNICGIKH